MAPYLGVTLEHTASGNADKPDFEAKRKAGCEFARAKIDAGIPCFGFDGGWPEYFTVNGYNKKGLVYWTHYAKEGYLERPWDKAGRNDVRFFEYVSVEAVTPKGDDRTAIREALAFALKIGRSKPSADGKNHKGIAGYDEWIRCLESGDWRKPGLPGVHHNSACWHECRAYAERFLRLAGEKLGGDLKPMFEQAADHYRAVRTCLCELQSIFIYKYPLPPVDDAGVARAVQLLRWAKQAEVKGLAVIEDILGKLTAGRSHAAVETKRLVIRPFVPEDWPGVMALGKDMEASGGNKYDHAWPTTEEGSKGAANFLSKRDAYWAVCLKDGGRLTGLIALSDIDANKQLDFGHVFHTQFRGGDYDTEAIERMIGYAFEHLDIRSIITKNAEEWEGQLTPLKKLGLKVAGRGKGSFHKDANGKPIEFTACEMTITKERWERRNVNAAEGGNP